MLIFLWCIVSLLAGILIGSFIRAAQFNAESRWSDPDFSIPEFNSMPDQSPSQLKINPSAPGVYKTQFTTKHGIRVTENKYWCGECWCEVDRRNHISFFQTRTWEMIEEEATA